MLTNMFMIRRQKPICDALEGRLTPAKFRDALNHHIHGYGDIGYDDADEMNLKTASKYTTEEAQELIWQIKESDGAPIRVEEIPEVPWSLAKLLADEVHGGTHTIQDAREGDIIYGALRGYELVGFVSGCEWNDWISVGGLYVAKTYRKKELSRLHDVDPEIAKTGLGNLMFEKLYEEAVKRGIGGIALWNASWRGQDALGSFHKYLESKGIPSEFRAYTDEMKNCAELRFD